MKHKIIKADVEFDFDDTVLFRDQPKDFQKVLADNLDENNIVQFDNASLILLQTGRVLVNSTNK